MSVHRRYQRTHHALVVILFVIHSTCCHSLRKVLWTQRRCVPDVDRAVSSCCYQIIQLIASHHGVHTTLVSSDRFKEIETMVRLEVSPYSLSTSQSLTVESRPPVAKIDPLYSQAMQSTSPSLAFGSVESLQIV